MRAIAKFALLFTLALIPAAALPASAQVSPAQAVPSGYVLQPEGSIAGALIYDVKITTIDEIGPYTAFLVQPPEDGAKPEWFYVRNDNSVKGMERGSIIGLLLGAAETVAWQRRAAPVNIRYMTIAGRKEIVAASLGSQP